MKIVLFQISSQTALRTLPLAYDLMSEEDAKALLRPIANAIYGPEWVNWRFIRDHKENAHNSNDVAKAFPAPVKAQEFGDYAAIGGNYIALRYYG